MVYFSTQAEIESAFGGMVGSYDYSSLAQHPDSSLAVALAQLQPGQSVLDVGAGGGRFIAAAKQRVGDGFCVAVDAVQGFISQDIPFMLQRNQLAVSPNGTPATQVHCVCANINDANFSATIPLPEPSRRFDCIVAVHLFTTLPPALRRPALVKLRQLLKIGGRLIVNMSARFTDSPPLASEAGTPVQFRTSPYTESPGSHIKLDIRNDQPAVPLPSGAFTLSKSVVLALQTCPNRLWDVAKFQAREAAENAGFAVQDMRNIGKGDGFGLAAGLSSPGMSTLMAMSNAEFVANASTRPEPGTYSCIGRGMDAVVQRRAPGMTDNGLVLCLQNFFKTDSDRLASNPLAHGVQLSTLEVAQVGVMMVLTKV